MSTKKTPIYISYAWGDDRETGPSRDEIVDRIYQSLIDDGYDVRRDRKDLKYKDSISEFMEKIGRSKCSIVVISDKYLRSGNCMFELVEIHRNLNFHERIYPIVLSDAKVHESSDRFGYVEFWDKEAKEIDNRIAQLDHEKFAATGSLLEVERIREISRQAALVRC